MSSTPKPPMPKPGASTAPKRPQPPPQAIAATVGRRYSGVYHNGDQQTRGTISIEGQKLVFWETPTEQLVQWDAKDLSATKDEHQLTIRYVKDNKQSMTTASFDLANELLGHLGIKTRTSAFTFLRAIQNASITSFLIIAVIAILAVVQIFRVKADWLAGVVTEKQEQRAGDKAFYANFASDEYQLPKFDSAWQNMLDKLNVEPEIAKTRWKTHIVRGDDPNVFALPGNHIIITSAFVQEAESAEEILGVIAHEMAHVRLNHHLENFAAADPAKFAMTFIMNRGGNKLYGYTHTRANERRADELGLRYLRDTRIPATGIAAFYRRQANKQLAWAHEHPLDETRMRLFTGTAASDDAGVRKIEFPLQELKDAIAKY